MFSIIKETCKNSKGCKCCYVLPFNLYKNIDSKIPKIPKMTPQQIKPSNNNSDINLSYKKKIKPFYMID